MLHFYILYYSFIDIKEIILNYYGEYIKNNRGGGREHSENVDSVLRPEAPLRGTGGEESRPLRRIK